MQVIERIDFKFFSFSLQSCMKDTRESGFSVTIWWWNQVMPAAEIYVIEHKLKPRLTPPLLTASV